MCAYSVALGSALELDLSTDTAGHWIIFEVATITVILLVYVLSGQKSMLQLNAVVFRFFLGWIGFISAKDVHIIFGFAIIPIGDLSMIVGALKCSVKMQALAERIRANGTFSLLKKRMKTLMKAWGKLVLIKRRIKHFSRLIHHFPSI
jgi:hypothetical protein